MTLPGILFLLGYFGFVFILPPVLGRRATRSRKVRIVFFCVSGIIAVLSTLSFLGWWQVSHRLHASAPQDEHANPHLLEEMAMLGTCVLPILGVTLLFGFCLGMAAWMGAGPTRPSEEGREKDSSPPTSPPPGGR